MDNTSNTSVEVRTLQSERYIATIKQNGKSYKVFQLSFGKDGSLFIHFPYHKNSNGLASVVSLNPGLSYPASGISLTDQGKVTSHKIKFSHHPDGRVHFSQTGKIFTRIKRQGTRLDQLNGHIFTIMLQGLSGFAEVTSKKDQHHHDSKRTVLDFNLEGMKDQAYKFVAIWNPFDEFVKQLDSRNIKKVLGPQMVRRFGKNPSGGFLLNPLSGNPMRGYVLTLAIESIPHVSKGPESTIVFIGGFDPIEIVNDFKKTSSFLALMYPTLKPDELKDKIGSIDFVQHK